MLVISLLLFAFTLWLASYLVARDLRDEQLRWAGGGLAAYSLIVAVEIVRGSVTPDGADVGRAALAFLTPLPGLFWVGALLHLLPEEDDAGPALIRWWRWLFTLLVFLAALSALVAQARSTPLAVGWAVITVVLLAAALLRLAQSARRHRPGRQATAVLVAATLFFALGVVALTFPSDVFSNRVMWLALSIDFLAFGVAVAALDALDQGERLAADMLRALGIAAAAVLVFGGQVALVVALATGVTPAMLALLLGTVAAAILATTFARPLADAVDRLTLSESPATRQERAQMREAAAASTRLNEELDLATLDEGAFARLTRRAFSHYGDLSRLGASPLTRLPRIDARLAEQAIPASTLTRANTLKALLAESVERLKPAGDASFGVSDEWRYYNALYFPYIQGLRPYSRRAAHHDLDEEARQALAWFQSQVPERTLHNWQNAAAALVAQELRETS